MFSSDSSTEAVEYYQEILMVAKQAARLAGDEIRRAWGEESSTTNTTTTTATTTISNTNKSSNVDLVTETDEKAEQLIIELLTKKYPDHKIIGEESSGADCHYVLTEEPTWTIDPIDGTTNFIHHLGLSCVLIAFLIQKDIKVGVTYYPTTEELFYAIKGQGAFVETRDGKHRPIHVSSTREISSALISMDPGYGRDEASIQRYITVQRDLLRQGVRSIRAYGCSGLCLANVACGRFDACFEEGSWTDHTGPKIWDLCSGKLLVEEAGGVTRDITHRTHKDQSMNILQRSSFAAATSELADHILDIMYQSTT